MLSSRKANRILALVAIAAAVFVLLFSNHYLSVHTAHHCDDSDHCPVCSMMLQCDSAVRTISSGIIIAAVVAFFVRATAIVVSFYDYQSVQTTLVSQKIRLDN